MLGPVQCIQKLVCMCAGTVSREQSSMIFQRHTEDRLQLSLQSDSSTTSALTLAEAQSGSQKACDLEFLEASLVLVRCMSGIQVGSKPASWSFLKASVVLVRYMSEFGLNLLNMSTWTFSASRSATTCAHVMPRSTRSLSTCAVPKALQQ